MKDIMTEVEKTEAPKTDFVIGTDGKYYEAKLWLSTSALPRNTRL